MTRNGKRSPIALQRSWQRDEVWDWAAGDRWVHLLAEEVLVRADLVDRMPERVLRKAAVDRARADRLPEALVARAVVPAAEVWE